MRESLETGGRRKVSRLSPVLLPGMCYGTRRPRLLRCVSGKNSQTRSKEKKRIPLFHEGGSIVAVLYDPVAFLLLSGPGAVDVAGFLS